MLLMTRRPSRITWGKAEKFSPSSVNWDTRCAASLPPAMAMAQSHTFSAGTSLTPSPIMATVWPAAFSASTRRRF